MKEKHITIGNVRFEHIAIGIICVALYAIIGGWIYSPQIREAEEANKRDQERKQAIAETLQEANWQGKFSQEYGDF